MTQPVRLQLRRAKGFDLQATSHARNGLPAMKVARPGRFGNPWSVQDAADVHDCSTASAHEHAVAWFREWISLPSACPKLDDAGEFGGTRDYHARLHAGLPELRGKNLACFCRLDRACHADILLIMANRPVCDAPEAVQ